MSEKSSAPMKSAFGIIHKAEHYPVDAFGKSIDVKDRRANSDASSGVIAGTGATVAGTGLVAGGIPGLHTQPDDIKYLRSGTLKQRATSAVKAGRGGIFGYRSDAHRVNMAQNRAKEKARRAQNKVWAKDAEDPAIRDRMKAGKAANMEREAWEFGLHRGKQNAEKKIIRHLNYGRKGAHVALGAGLATTALGVGLAHRNNENRIKKSQQDTDRLHGALLGGGTVAAGGMYGGEKILRRQQQKWDRKAKRSLKQKHLIAPYLAHEENRRWEKVIDEAPGVFSRVNGAQNAQEAERGIRRAGRLATGENKAKYFARTYGDTAKVVGRLRTPAIATAAVGGTGLLLSRHERKKKP